jgi:hypothetical protein
MLTKEQLTALASVESPPVVSIYLPTHEKGRETRQDPIRFKNALDAAVQELIEAGHRRPEAEALLEGARALLDDELFWRHQGKGLAVFAASGLFQHHRLPIEVPELELVGPRPHVRPQLPLLADDGQFYVLAASAGDTRLYTGSRFGLTEVEAELPRSVAEISAETDYQNMRHAAPPARPRSAGPVGMPATHNFGEDPEEQRKAQLIEHLRRLHNALEGTLGGSRQPIVLVAAPEVRGHLQALAKNITFFGEGIQFDPGALGEEELHARAYELVRPSFAQRRADAIDRFQALAGSNDPRGATDLKTIVEAAGQGRVDTLLVAEGRHVWGSPGATAGEVRLDPEPTPENEDLVDHAAVQTLLQGGQVHVLRPEDMPRDAPMVAIFRF